MGEEMGQLFPWIYAIDKKKEKRPENKYLPEACGQGDPSAMLELSEYLRGRMPKYDGGANMWLLRAAIYGNRAAQEKLQEMMRQKPDFLEKCLFHYENFLPGRRDWLCYGNYSGYLLNAVGLLAFQFDHQSYMLQGLSEERMIVVWQETDDYEPPDEDGFGREDYYNIFCLDEFFQYLPGVPVVYHVTSNDVRNVKEPKDRYDAMIYEMKKALDKRKKPDLWMDFLPKK